MTGRADELRKLGGLKWTFYDRDVLPAWVAEMDFGVAPSVQAALHDAVDRGLTGYPYPDAETAIAVAAADYWADRFEWKVDPAWVFPAPDVIEGLRRCIGHLTRPGSPVVLHTPVYFPFFSMVNRAGRRIIEVPSPRDEAGRYSLDLDGIENGFKAGAGSVVVCNPWNPTGRVFSRRELEELVYLAERYDARVIADEIHSPIIYDGVEHVPIATIDSERTMSVNAASKAWDLPGLKCAQVVLTNVDDRAVWQDYFTPEKVGVGTLGLLAGEAAYSGGREWFDDVLGRLQSNRDLLMSLVAIHVPDALVYPPEGTYLAWMDLSPYGLEVPTEFILDEGRVALTGGAPFRGDSSQFARLNFATEPEILIEMMERVGTAVRRR
ncbi:MAG TPA: aminotransferase class I/II-fold pyridoxal phosphate-dependent enzyme [Acidimicrobiia bacterium]